MSYQLRIKRSNTAGAVPNNLGYGELAYNFADAVLYIGDRYGRAIRVGTPVGDEPAQRLEPPHAENSSPATGYTTTGIRRRLLPFE